MVLGTRLLCGAAVLAVLAMGCGGDAKPPPPGVSDIDYSPKPFRKGVDEMTVRFTTTGAAGDDLHGRHYEVLVVTGKDDRDQRCYPEFTSYEDILGEPGRTSVVEIEMVYENHHEEQDPGYACFGPAEIVVVAENEGGFPLEREVMRRLSFRILPPATTESYGTIPMRGATAAWRASLEADFETVVAVECYRVDPNYFECGSDLKASDGSVFTQDGSVLCEPKCVGHIGVGRGAYDD